MSNPPTNAPGVALTPAQLESNKSVVIYSTVARTRAEAFENIEAHIATLQARVETLEKQNAELVSLLQEIDQGLWQNFVSVRYRLADITAIWELSRKWRAALNATHSREGV